MVYNNYRGIKGLQGAFEALKQMGEEFTRTQYDKAKARGASSVTRLKEEGVLKVVRTETFEKEVEVPYWKRGRSERVLVNDKGEPVGITPNEYKYANEPIRRALDLAYNNGHPLTIKKIEMGDTEKIMCKRFYYAVDTAAFDKLYARQKKQFKRVVDRKKYLAEKATKTYNKVADLYATL